MFIRHLTSVLLTKSFINKVKILGCSSLFHKNILLTNNRFDYSVLLGNHLSNFNKSVTIRNNQLNHNNEIDISREKIIKSLNFQCEEDAQPFYNLSLKTLIQIYNTTKKDRENGYCENRLYYISQRLQCSPTILSKHIVKRTFLYKLSFDWLENSLNILLEMNVSGDRILRDLWVLKYNHKTIQERLLYVRNAGIDNLYPWMVRCSEDILKRYIQISQDTKSILGEYKSTKIYLAKRLNTSVEAIEDMYLKVPALKTIRVIKAQKFLDFLISEGFEVEDIANKLRIFSASQNTVKQRLEKLRKLGINNINLNVLCRSRKDFQKYCESIESISKPQ